jgi:hypothetical protein
VRCPDQPGPARTPPRLPRTPPNAARGGAQWLPQTFIKESSSVHHSDVMIANKFGAQILAFPPCVFEKNRNHHDDRGPKIHQGFITPANVSQSFFGLRF